MNSMRIFTFKNKVKVVSYIVADDVLDDFLHYLLSNENISDLYQHASMWSTDEAYTRTHNLYTHIYTHFDDSNRRYATQCILHKNILPLCLYLSIFVKIIFHPTIIYAGDRLIASSNIIKQLFQSPYHGPFGSSARSASRFRRRTFRVCHDFTPERIRPAINWIPPDQTRNNYCFF